MYPLHIALASTSRSSSDVEGAADKTGPNSLLTSTNTIRVIQLVEMPAPPRRMPPSSASASSSSSSAFSEEQEDEDCDSYCSSVADEDDEEEALAREAEASKVGRILAWRSHLVSLTMPHDPLSLSPTTPRPHLVPPPFSQSPTTPRIISNKRSAASSSCFSESSAPRSKRSRTSSVHCTAGPSEYSRVVDTGMTDSSSRIAPAPLFLAPPSPTTLARRHTSPRHQRHSSSPPASSSTPALSLTTPTPDLQRAFSMTASMSPRETLCPACDHAFSSVRAFRVHALHSADADASAACGAAVAYAMESVRGS